VFVVSVQGNDLSYLHAIAMMDPNVMRMTGHARHVREVADRCLDNRPIVGSMDLDMPAIPVFVRKPIRLIKPHISVARNEPAHDHAIGS
jgi:hypothetical protein